MRRAISIFAILLLVPAFVFGQGHMRSVNPHPPMGGPGNDMFGGASSFTVSGKVTAINGNLISIASGLVVIDASNAKFAAPTGDVSTINAIAPGDFIVAMLKTTDVAPNAPLPAALIGVVKLPDPGLAGPVQSVDKTTQSLTILGQTIFVTPDTRFVGGMFRPIAGLNDIANGQVVAVQASVSGGRLVADSVMVMSISMMPMPATLIHGTVKTIASDSWTITDRSGKDVVVVVNSDTKIIGSPVVGSVVDVFVIADGQNRYVAVTIIRSYM